MKCIRDGEIQFCFYSHPTKAKRIRRYSHHTYTSQHGDSGGLVYSYTSSTNTRYTVGINRGSVIYNGEKLGVCVKAYMINKRLEVERY